MPSSATENACPFCKEEIKPGALKCKHCSSRLGKAVPPHEGICPYCKESIKPDAIKCKHCKTSLVADSGCGCNDITESEPVMALRATRRRFGLREDAGKWLCVDGVMWCADRNGVFTPCGSCLGGYTDSFPYFHGRFI